MPSRQVAFPPPLEALTPLKAPPLNDREMLEKVPPEALPVKVKDPDKDDPEVPVSFSLEKVLWESANAGRDKSNRKKHATAANLQLLLIELPVYNTRESIPSVTNVKIDNCCDRLQSLATSTIRLLFIITSDELLR